ncbi:MAG: hypothetical protein V4679_17810 [Pseudomonadota bacterium]
MGSGSQGDENAVAGGQGAAGTGVGVGGNSIAQILAESCPQHAGAAGIVIARLDARAGIWQYSVDNGANWRDARTDLINRPGAMGLALDRDARLRLLPRLGERVVQIHIVLHAVQHSLYTRNGSHSAYVPDPSEGDSPAIALALDINAINGTPPQVHVPRPRNKRAMAQARGQSDQQAPAGTPSAQPGKRSPGAAAVHPKPNDGN